MSAESGRVAIVTGASAGIGRATALALRDRGMDVVSVARRLPNDESSRSCDITDEPAVRRVFDEIFRHRERIDVLVNCAGVTSRADPLNLAVGEWERVMRTNVIGTYLCCKHAVPAMRRGRYGRIVNVSSIAGRTYSRTASVAYTASKYAVIGLTRHLAAHVGTDGITVNCVAPSQTKTEMLVGSLTEAEMAALAARVPVRRLADPTDIAEAIAFLTSQAAGYINGAVLDINGGQW